MLNILDISYIKLLNHIRKEQQIRLEKNKEEVKNYIIKTNITLDLQEKKDKYELEILFMIQHSVSLKFISKYFNLREEDIKEIASRNKCQSYLLSSFTENPEARCFSKNQILRSCEDFNYICPMCFKPLDITDLDTLTGHHIQPFARGGKTIKDNCLPLHVRCHFEDFKLLHSALFDSEDPIYSAKYFNSLKDKLKKEESGITHILKKNFPQLNKN